MNSSNFIKLFIFLVLSSYVGAQLSAMQPSCVGDGTIEYLHCCRALMQFTPDGSGDLVETRTKVTKNNFSCQLTLENKNGGQLKVSTSVVTQAIQAILEHCGQGAGSVNLPKLSTKPNEPDIQLSIGFGSGKYL
ncbi:hypothetical protein CROQUDRAFT_134167 [Cronartium quercuum f. sp. fusiforme G11]|uniref:Uncharacterized protein n=1 Tax=Cronartium quercuum f. sp. fusiforme G11 TaxID=708437 RepID=A0A9P6NIE7_9BASI|nr:hypothetical protein CROQUDRAFT_134167 [Cronartium quercuum f. sp. fusiforme G11]